MALITFAGFSRVDGVLKFRTACDSKRIAQLIKLGDTEVDIDKLPLPMDKNEAVKYVLANIGRFQVDAKEAEALLTGLVKDENPFARQPNVVKKTATVKVTKPGLKIGSVVVRADDAPYTPKQAAKIRAEFMKKLKIAYEAN
jgi:hypothetical protein